MNKKEYRKLHPYDRHSEFNDIEDIKNILPKNINRFVDYEVLSLLKGLGDEIGSQQFIIEEMFIQHIPTLRLATNMSMQQYVHAIKYVALKRRCETITEAWTLTFPAKYKKLIAQGKEHLVSSYASNYNNGMVVTKIEADSMVALHLQYSGFRHASIRKQYELMNGKASPSLVPATKRKNGVIVPILDENGDQIINKVYNTVSPTVQHLASAKLFEMTDIPHDNSIELKIGLSDDVISEQKQMMKQLNTLALMQQKALEEGKSITDVQVIGNVLQTKEEDEEEDDEEL